MISRRQRWYRIFTNIIDGRRLLPMKVFVRDGMPILTTFIVMYILDTAFPHQCTLHYSCPMTGIQFCFIFLKQMIDTFLDFIIHFTLRTFYIFIMRHLEQLYTQLHAYEVRR